MKRRLDQILVASGLAESRKKAQALIMAGQVLVDDTPVDKSGALVSDQAHIRIRGNLSKYVSRGGDKLEGAIRHFNLDLGGCVALDIGASTGGFTDCLLQHGASKVFSVDVGHAQIAEKLRHDPRVTVFEKTHVKDITREMFNPAPNLVVIDVSFIGLRKVLPYILSVISGSALVLALVKPQFELGPEFVKKGGLVPREEDQLLAVQLVREFAKENEVEFLGSVPSVLKGDKSGNQEYFVLLRPRDEDNKTGS